MHTKFERKCIACRNNFQQKEMLRIAKIDNQILIDEKGKLGGRGCYICKNEQCFSLMMKKRLLNRAFKMNITQEVYDKLGEYAENN
ncbi:MAG: YlxR family protein [Clostridia bacterium]|nr:YlxR family protein [Clostridia bacterium]